MEFPKVTSIQGPYIGTDRYFSNYQLVIYVIDVTHLFPFSHRAGKTYPGLQTLVVMNFKQFPGIFPRVFEPFTGILLLNKLQEWFFLRKAIVCASVNYMLMHGQKSTIAAVRVLTAALSDIFR